jgi:hypothetical protein
MDFDDSDGVNESRGKLRVYIAARFARKAEVAELAGLIECAGAEVCTAWFNDPMPADADLDDYTVEQAEALASRDLSEMRSANLCISLTEDPNATWKRGGRHQEFGFCLGQGLPLWIVGPRETIYHYLPWVECFATVQEMLDALRQEVAEW